MTSSLNLSELESSPAAKFENLGDRYVGRITDIDNTRPQTDPVTGEVKRFSDGQPMPILLITIEQADGEAVTLYAKGGNHTAVEGEGQAMAKAIALAVRAAGSSTIDAGGELAVVFSGLAEKRQGLNPAKLFVAQYRPPAPSSVAVTGDLFG